MASAHISIPRNDLVDGYRGVRRKAKNLLCNLRQLQLEQRKLSLPRSGVSSRVQAVIDGRNVSDIGTTGLPSKTQALVRVILSYSEKTVDLVVAHLEDHLYWMQATGEVDHLGCRNVYIFLTSALERALPDAVRSQCQLGFMHFEHENLNRQYANKETMILSSPVSEIPRKEFYMTEDNYAWDMSELVAAIVSNGGVMRNPLSKQMFTPNDVQAILKHPRGKKLAALQVEQQQLSRGVRKETIAWIERLARSMETERGRDWNNSWELILEFQRYVARLPEREQKTIRAYRCPMAFDSHARKAYDTTIQEILDGVYGGTLCVHKGSDYLRQSAAHLKALPSDEFEAEGSDGRCLVM